MLWAVALFRKHIRKRKWLQAAAGSMESGGRPSRGGATTAAPGLQ